MIYHPKLHGTIHGFILILILNKLYELEYPTHTPVSAICII